MPVLVASASLGRRIERLAMDGASRMLSYQYHPAGPRSRITWPDNLYVSYDYDGINRLTLLREYGTTSLVGLSYAAHGALNARSSESGAAGLSDAQHDGVQRPSFVAHNLPGSSGDVSWTFGRNNASQLTSVTRNNDAYAWTGHVATNRPYTVNRLNQYTAAGSTTFGYDLNGNLTASGSDAYVYDVENRLVGASGSHSAALRYDPLGRLYEVTGAGTTTRFLYDGDALVAEYNTSGSLIRRHVHGSDAVADDPLVTYEGGTRRNLYADHQGSIVGSATAAGAVSLNAYDEYGIPNPGWTVSSNGRFGYTGQAWLAELGMWHYKARIYSPTLGRFLQTDPIGYDDQINLYAYVGNDPVNHTDPDGKTCRRAADNWVCRVDIVDRTRLTRTQRAQLARFERQYTRAVNRLLSLPNSRIRVGASARAPHNNAPLGEFGITRREAAANLIGRRFSFRPGDTTAGRTATAYTPGTVGPRGTGSVTSHLTDRGLAIGNAVTAVHEGGLHGSAQEYRGGLVTPSGSLLGTEPYSSGHQAPYREASCQLLEEC